MAWFWAMVLTALGTYLLRLVPLGLALGRNGSRTAAPTAATPAGTSSAGAAPLPEAAAAGEGRTAAGLGHRIAALATPAIITALLAVAVVPSLSEAAPMELVRRGAGLTAAALVFRWRPSLAAAVLTGILVYAAAAIML